VFPASRAFSKFPSFSLTSRPSLLAKSHQVGLLLLKLFSLVNSTNSFPNCSPPPPLQIFIRFRLLGIRTFPGRCLVSTPSSLFPLPPFLQTPTDRSRDTSTSLRITTSHHKNIIPLKRPSFPLSVNSCFFEKNAQKFFPPYCYGSVFVTPLTPPPVPSFIRISTPTEEVFKSFFPKPPRKFSFFCRPVPFGSEGSLFPFFFADEPSTFSAESFSP